MATRGKNREVPGQLSLEDHLLKQVDVRLVLKESSPLYSTQPLSGPEQAAEVMAEALKDLDREMVCVVNLDIKLRPINYNVVSIGSLDSSMVPIQNVFKSSILSNAGSIMLLHTHPSGDVRPSREDRAITRRLVEVGKLMDIPVIDHVIIGAGNGLRYSFREIEPDLFDGSVDLQLITTLTSEGRGVSEMADTYTGKMSFEEFSSMVQEEIHEHLSDRFQDAEITVQEIHKLGESYQGMVIRGRGQVVSPTINLDEFYQDYLGGVTKEGTLSTISELIEMKTPEISSDFLQNYDHIKNQLFVRVSDAGKNQEALAVVPHRNVEDLAMTYHIRIEMPGQGVGNIMVTNEMMNRFGISEAQLHDDAIRSSQALFPAVFAPMETLVFGVPEEKVRMDGRLPMMILTNKEMAYGASAMFYPDQMDQIAEKIGGSYFILPSSVHEIITIPDNGSINYQDLERMVSDINVSQVAENEQLSNRVYHFDAKERSFELASSHEAKAREKEQVKGRGSILRKLDEKKQEAGRAAKSAGHDHMAKKAEASL